MKTTIDSTAPDLTEEVVKFVDDFVANATPEEMDRFLDEGGADFYDAVSAPELVIPHTRGDACVKRPARNSNGDSAGGADAGD